jgi:hypothetical protein
MATAVLIWLRFLLRLLLCRCTRPSVVPPLAWVTPAAKGRSWRASGAT